MVLKCIEKRKINTVAIRISSQSKQNIIPCDFVGLVDVEEIEKEIVTK